MMTERVSKVLSRVAFGVCAWLCFAAPTLAGEGITVMGTGSVDVKPQLAVLGGVVTGDAELAADAVIKFQDNKRRAVESIEAVGLDGIGIEGDGFMISSATDPSQMQAIMMGQPPTTDAQPVSVSERLEVTLSGIDQMDDVEVADAITNIVDAGKDAGVTLGGGGVTNMIQMQLRGNAAQPLAVFRLSDPDAVRQQAAEAAMADARAKAQRLADLAGVKLGKVVSISETAPPADESGNPEVALFARIYGMGEEVQAAEPQSDAFADIEVKASLIVQFEIE